MRFKTKFFSVSFLALLLATTGCPGDGPTVPPTITSFTASASDLPAGGAQVTFAWVESDATSLTLSGFGAVDGNTQVTFVVRQTNTFTLTATNDLGSVQKTVTVNVEAPTSPPTIQGFTASPSTLPIGGGQTKLQWSVQGATSLFLDNGAGDVSNANSYEAQLSTTTTYNLTATNALGSVSLPVTVTVTTPTAPPQISSFSASANNLPPGGGDVTLSWAETGAQQLSIDNGVGNVFGKNSVSVRVTQSTAYKLTADNVYGPSNTPGHDDQIVLVNVTPEPAPTINSFTVSPSSLPQGGGTVTVSWSTTNADSVDIEPGIGGFDGSLTSWSESLFVTSSTTFTLTARNSDGTATFAVPVTVAQ